MKLKAGDYIVGADIAKNEHRLLVVGENGYGKVTELSEYRGQTRGGSGILTMNCTDKTGKIVSAEVVEEQDKLVVLTNGGQGIRIKIKDIRLVKRVAQGVKLINLKDGDTVASIARLVHAPDEGDNPEFEDDEDGIEQPVLTDEE
jgi:DNA gyrase subunit A